MSCPSGEIGANAPRLVEEESPPDPELSPQLLLMEERNVELPSNPRLATTYHAQSTVSWELGTLGLLALFHAEVVLVSEHVKLK